MRIERLLQCSLAALLSVACYAATSGNTALVDAVKNQDAESVRALLKQHVDVNAPEADGTTADYIAFGPILPTASKDNPDPVVGLEGLRQARRATRKPLVAIGGINLHNAREVLAAGADSVAVIGGLLDAPDLAERAREFLSVLS